MSKAKECARNSNTPFKANHGWCEKFVKLIIMTKGWKLVRNFLQNLKLNWLNFVVYYWTMLKE
jgi:hypothetical protein